MYILEKISAASDSQPNDHLVKIQLNLPNSTKKFHKHHEVIAMSHNVIFLILCGCGLPGGRDRWDEKENVDPRLLFRNGLHWTVI